MTDSRVWTLVATCAFVGVSACLGEATGREADRSTDAPATKTFQLHDRAGPDALRDGGTAAAGGQAPSDGRATWTASSLLGPGVHVVAGSAADRIDPREVRRVDEVMELGDVESRTGFQSAGRLQADRSIYVVPVDVTSTDLASADFAGYFRAGTCLEAPATFGSNPGKGTGRKGWTGLTRIFRGYGTIGTVVLDEDDFRATDGTMVVPRGALNTKVAGYPATLTRLRDGAGRTIAHLDWIDARGHQVALTIRQVDDASVRSLQRLGESVARAGSVR